MGLYPVAVVLQYTKNTKKHIHTLKTIHNTQNHKHNAYNIRNTIFQPNKETENTKHTKK